jgi:hypothetical protein
VAAKDTEEKHWIRAIVPMIQKAFNLVITTVEIILLVVEQNSLEAIDASTSDLELL